jgi:anion-transporting  ArsA/GET3 family ATPase
MSLFNRRFIINIGKGGVGKSTVSAAMAVAAARLGKRVLVVEIDTVERISQLLDVEQVGAEVTPVLPNIWLANITSDSAMKEYVMRKIRSERLYRAVFENRFMRQFLNVIPGLRELVLIGKASFHEQELDETGNPKYDCIIVDAPASGHGLFLLRIPKVVVETVSSGPLVAECQEILSLLQDPERTCVNLITLSEEMPANETIELYQSLVGLLEIPVGHLVINRLYPPVFSEEQTSAIEALTAAMETDPDPTLEALLIAARFRVSRCALQAHYRKLLQERLRLPTVEIPFQFLPDFTRTEIESISTLFDPQKEIRGEI